MSRAPWVVAVSADVPGYEADRRLVLAGPGVRLLAPRLRVALVAAVPLSLRVVVGARVVLDGLACAESLEVGLGHQLGADEPVEITIGRSRWAPPSAGAAVVFELLGSRELD